MTQAQLDCAVAEATGDPIDTVRHLGFSLLVEEHRDAEKLRLVVPCPHCGRAVAYPGRSGDGSPALAECVDCDVFFAAADGDVVATDEDDATPSSS